DGLYWRAEEEEMIEELKMEVKAKEGCIEELKARIVFRGERRIQQGKRGRYSAAKLEDHER
ncbi:hypothetical protein OIU85_024722, partial [Salix viminalis]